MSKNKVKFGLKNVNVFPITEATSELVTYSEPIKMKGAVNLSLSPRGEESPFYADDITYYNQFGNDGYEGDFELALVPDEFLQEILGQTVDKNGVVVESVKDKGKSFAMTFEIDGDVNESRVILYNCSASRPETEASTTEGGKKEPQTDKLSFVASASMDTGIIKAKVEKGSTAYDEFLDTVYKVVPSPEV